MVNREAFGKCEEIISRYMALRNPSPKSAAMFQKWLFAKEHCTEKSIIMRRIFYKMSNKPSMRWKEE